MSTARNVCEGCGRQAFLLRKEVINDFDVPFTVYVYSCDDNCPEEEVRNAIETYRNTPVCGNCREWHVTMCNQG